MLHWMNTPELSDGMEKEHHISVSRGEKENISPENSETVIKVNGSMIGRNIVCKSFRSVSMLSGNTSPDHSLEPIKRPLSKSDGIESKDSFLKIVSVMEKVTSLTKECYRPRVVSGNLIIDKGIGVMKKTLKWRDDNMVSIDFFDFDESERVNVFKIKLKEKKQKFQEEELIQVRNIMASNDSKDIESAKEEPWSPIMPISNRTRTLSKSSFNLATSECKITSHPHASIDEMPINSFSTENSYRKTALRVGGFSQRKLYGEK